jgi:hypothetical protein
MKIGVIVEGHGEVTAIPILIRRIAEERHHDLLVQVPPPLRLSRGKMTKPSELARAVAPRPSMAAARWLLNSPNVHNSSKKWSRVAFGRGGSSSVA